MVELLVAMLLLEVAAVLSLVATMSAHRHGTASRGRAAFDLARRDSVAMAAAQADCRDAPQPEARDLILPPGPGRAALPVVIRCGR